MSNSSPGPDRALEPASPPSFTRVYLPALSILAVAIALAAAIARGTSQPLEPELFEAQLLAPLFAMVALTAAVLLLMMVVRNLAVFFGRADASYYVDYVRDVPEEWIERPARTFGNLLQVPILFYLLVALMLSTQRADAIQVQLAWLFFATRCLHSAVYILLNRVELRFAIWMSGCITLGIMWVRFGSDVLAV